MQENISFLVRYAPRQLHPVIAGRAEPPLFIAGIRAAGQVSAFYRQRRIHLTGEEAETLAERTGGWAAGMQMAALSLQEGNDRIAVIERFRGCDRLLAGYFMGEVFSGFGPNASGSATTPSVRKCVQ